MIDGFEPSPTSRSENRNRGAVHPTDLSSLAFSGHEVGRDRARRALSERLSNLATPPTEEERAWLKQWEPMLQVSRWGEWGLSWLRALGAYGTPSTFLDGLAIRVNHFRMLGMEWPALCRSGGNNELRRELIAKQTPYSPRGAALERSMRRQQDSCVLCQNIFQGFDSALLPPGIPGNCMLDLDDWIVAPNRYPAFPLHMLWLPKDHDDLSARSKGHSVTGADGLAGLTIPEEPGKTRGALVNSRELEALFSLSSALGVVALRNHPLSGMSLREHDHWHLTPVECYPIGWFVALAHGGEFADRQSIPIAESEVEVLSAQGTPFDVIVLRHSELPILARETARIMNALELDGQIFAPMFVPPRGPDSPHGMVMLSPLKKAEVADRYVQVGGAVVNHDFSPSLLDTQARLQRYAPLRLEFDWSRFRGGRDAIARRYPVYSKAEILARHRPLNYRDISGWGDGSNILSDLSPLAREVYHSLLPFQDKRGDRGHVDIVVHFTLRLAELLTLSDAEREAVVLAAIAHDCGWDAVPHIDEVWGRLVTRVHTGTAEDRKVATREMFELRWPHQQLGAERIRSLLPLHPFIDQIAAVVGDHDTRTMVAPPIFRAFLDADWLWRVTMIGVLATKPEALDRSDPEAVFSRLKGAVTPPDLTLPWVHSIARLECAASMLAMTERFSWRDLPEQFVADYSDEIAVVRMRRD